LGTVIGQKFQRNESMESRVLSLIYDTHPADAQLLDDAVVGDNLVDHS
jgi:hypothetical protein